MPSDPAPSRRFSVTGMNCAACSARVEKAVRAVPGVEECAVSLLTNEMSVAGSASDEAIVAAVEAAGYGAAPVQRTGDAPEPPMAEPGREARGLRARLVASLALLAVLMYGTMGHMMLGWPLPAWFTQPEPNHVAMGVAQLLLAGAILVLNGHFFSSGFRGALVFRQMPLAGQLVPLSSEGDITATILNRSFIALKGSCWKSEAIAVLQSSRNVLISCC